LVPFWHILYLKSSLLWMTSWAKPWLMYMWGTTSSIGTWLLRSMVRTRSMFSWIENMDRCLHGSSSMTLLNMGAIHKHYIQWSTVPIGSWNSATDFCPWYTFSPQKSYQCMVLLFSTNAKWGGHVNSAVTVQLPPKVKTPPH
jgi:hypothetical protein